MLSDAEVTRLRLAAMQRSEVRLRELVDILLAQGEAVFNSRSWRWGSALTAALAWLSRGIGRRVSRPQSIVHWRGIVHAHYAALQRDTALLEQSCTMHEGPQAVDSALLQLWKLTNYEHVQRPGT